MHRLTLLNYIITCDLEFICEKTQLTKGKTIKIVKSKQ